MADIKTPIGDAPVIPVVLLMLGGYLAWFGVHYFKADQKWPTDPIKSVLTGGGTPSITYQQEDQRQTSLSSYLSSATGSGTAAPAAGGVGSQIAADARRYIGTGYVFGGPADRPGNWDCSSFVSYVLGHDLNMPLPGGHFGDPGYPPHSHGPTTGTYTLWGTSINQGQVQAGDLVVWSTHMGVAIDATHIVSARDPKDGVGIDTITGTTSSLNETPHFRRVPA